MNRKLRPGDHVCVMIDETLPFIVDGVNRHELCLYMGSDQSVSAARKQLEESPVEFISLRNFVDENGFNSVKIVDTLKTYAKRAKDSKFSGLRVVQEMGWVGQTVGNSALHAYELEINRSCREMLFICCYNKQSPADLLLLALRTHPLVIMDNLLCKNFYYLPYELKEDSSVVITYFENLSAFQRLEKTLKRAAWKRTRQLSASERKYRALVEHVPDAVYSLDSKGHIVETSPALSQMLGYSKEEVTGWHFSKILHPDDWEKATLSFRALAEKKRDKTLGLQLRLVTKDGKVRIGELNAKALYKGGTFLGTEGILRDITERKEQEQKLEFLAGVVENVMEAVIITDAKGLITYVNPAACTMTGYTCGELIGTLATLLYSKNSQVTFQDIVKNVSKGDWEGEMVAIRKTGKRFPLWLRASGLRNQKGEITALVSVSRDITEYKEAEEKLQRYALLLEMKVREKTKGTETLLQTSYALRSTSDWKKGTEIITKGIVEGLRFDRAAVFFLNEYDQILECRGQLNISETLLTMKVPLSDSRYAMVKCVKDKKPLLVRDALTDPRVGAHLEEEGREFVWVPILFQSVVLGAIYADREKSQTPIESEDVDILELYANQIAEFIERTRIVVEPEVEKQMSTPLKYALELQEVYLIEEERPEKAFDIFADLVKHGFKGFGICRTHPQKIREKYTLEKTPVMWLSEMESKKLEHIGPLDMPKLIYVVAEFVKRAQPAVVILEGLEYLVVQNDFKTVLKLLHTLADYVATSQSILLLPVNPEILPTQEHIMLKRAFRTLGPQVKEEK